MQTRSDRLLSPVGISGLMSAQESSVSGARALIFAAPMYEDLELWYPKLRLAEAGMEVTVAGMGESSYVGKKGHPIHVDTDVDDVQDRSYDVVVVPGGFGPDVLRTNKTVLQIVKSHLDKGAVVAVICHGGWVLVSAGVLKGRTVTAWGSLQDDIENAGATFVDQEVVVDDNLVTSRNPDDLPAFCREILNLASRQQVTPGQAW